MRVIFANRFYWPESPATGQLLTDLAEALAARGHDVSVITSHSGAADLPGSETRHGVRIWRVRSTRWTEHGIFGKACDFLTFFLGALWQLGRRAGRNVIIVAMTDPPLFGIGASLIAGARGARTIHWIQDIYPELAVELAGQRWLRLVRVPRNDAWRTAAHCVTLGEDMAGVLKQGGVSSGAISIVPNWAPVGLVPAEPATVGALRHEWRLSGKFVVAYSGNLGRVHDLEPILAVAEHLRNEPKIIFALVGGGAQRAKLEAKASQLNLPNIIFLPAQPRERLAATLGVGDLHLVTVRPGCEHLVFPSKLSGICAIGRPILFIGPPGCEIAQIVTEHDLGIVSTREDTPAIANLVRRLARAPEECARFGGAALQFAANHSFCQAVGKWERVLSAVGACPVPSPAPISAPSR